MPDQGLLVIAPVRAGREETLRQTLNRLGNDIRGVRTPAGEPRIDFPRSVTTHFARLTLLPDPDRGPTRQRLLIATDFDGPWERHARELVALTRQPDAIWGHCEGYEGPGHFPDFLRRHAVEPGAYFIAFRGTSLARIRDALRLRDALQDALTDPKARERLRPFPDLRDLHAGLRRLGRIVVRPWIQAGRFALATGELATLIRRLGLRACWQAARRINATLNRVFWIRIFNTLTRNRPVPRPHPFSQATLPSPPSATPPGYPPEDAVLQNQLTLLTEVEPRSLPVLRAVLALIDLNGRRLSEPGSLVGISTIHTVRWAILDHGRRLLLVSNYDGTWENYIDEFAEMILSGLDALWTSAPDYPAAGAQDVDALKQFLRRHQAHANAFYSAYPETTVLNLRHDLDFAQGPGRLLHRFLTAPQPAPPTPDP